MRLAYALILSAAGFHAVRAQYCVIGTCQMTSGFAPAQMSVSVWDRGKMVCHRPSQLISPVGSGEDSETWIDVPCYEPRMSARATRDCSRIEYNTGDPDFYTTVMRVSTGEYEADSYCCVGCCPPPGSPCPDIDPPPDFNCLERNAWMYNEDATCRGIPLPSMCGEDRYAHICRGFVNEGPKVYRTYRSRTDNPPESPRPDFTQRIMIIGDSMTHGGEGDFTWRSRIWTWLRGNQADFTFVGPYRGVQSRDLPRPPAPPAFPNEPSGPPRPHTPGGYAYDTPQNFIDNDYHFASWGYQAAQAQGVIEARVRSYTPTMLLIKLGFNDMGWFISDARGTINSMRLLVENARRANPSITFVIANVVHRTFIGGRQDLVDKTNEYNRLLPGAIREWTTENSPVFLVDVNSAYDCSPVEAGSPDAPAAGCRAAYDGLHPNELGDYQIARAFAQVLRTEVGIGRQELVIPDFIPPRAKPVPRGIRATGAPMGVVITWEHVFGCSYNFRSRLAGQSEWSVGRVNTNRADITFTLAGFTWEVQVQSCHGDVCGFWSDTYSAVAEKTTPTPPRNITTFAINGGLDIRWRVPEGNPGVDRYEVMTWNRDCAGCFINGVGARGLSTTLNGFVNGNLYSVWMRTWGAGGGGLYEQARPIRPGLGTPGTPRNFVVRNVEPMGTTVNMNWEGGQGAAGYLMYMRNINEAGSQLRTDGNVLLSPDHGIAFLWPGTWNYEFCVSAVNGQLESGRSNCVIPEKPPGF